MYAIIIITTTKETYRKDIEITVRPTKDAAENTLEAVIEFLSDWKKDNQTTIVSKIEIESETSGKILATLKFY